MAKNPFALYDHDLAEQREATKAIRKRADELIRKVSRRSTVREASMAILEKLEPLLVKHENVGAGDTDSRDNIYVYITDRVRARVA